MKYIINTILTQINDNLPSDNEEMMIKINSFSTMDYYYEICKAIDHYCKNNNILCEIKLANNKYEEFRLDNSNFSILEDMKKNNWIADTESITFYRNHRNYKLLVLLGTEEEDDKDGLLNCSEITPESIARKLENNYFELFKNSFDDSINDESIKTINKLYKDLFEYVPVDVCKLSDIADKWEDEIEDIEDFIKRFYSNLPEWGLPLRIDNIPSIKKINKTSNVLQIEYKFISHKLFSEIGTNKFNEYLQKFDEYKIKNGFYSTDDYKWEINKLSNYEEYIAVLTDFISSKNLNENRNLLINCDIAIAQDIFGLVIETEITPSKNKEISLVGSPLKIFTEVLLNTLHSYEDKNISKVRISINKISLLIGVSQIEQGDDTTNEDILRYTWKNFCCHTNGILEYINNREWLLNNNEVTIDLIEEQKNIFNPLEYADDKIDIASSTKKNNTILFETECIDIDGNIIPSTKSKYKWTFTNNDSWLNEFAPICNSNIFSTKDAFIPLNTLQNINNLISSSSQEEFFDLLNNSDFENSDDNDIYSYIFNSNRLNPKTDSDYAAPFIELGKYFIQFGRAINEEGYFKQLLDNNSYLFLFIKSYKQLGTILTERILPDDKKWLLSAFINSFCIEKNMNSVKADSESSSCIVPPWNPIALEKLNDQKVFFLDGCLEWWTSHVSDRGFCKHLNHQMEILEEMSIVKNAAVIFPASNQRFYGAINSFGSYSLYASEDFNNTNRIKDTIQKDAIFDDSFTKEELIGISENSKMILNIIKAYVNSFTYAKYNLKLTFINPGELQPIISAIYNYVKLLKSLYLEQYINIELHILIKPENRGGKNYLSYWMNEFFSEDKYTTVKTYLTEWSKLSELKNIVDQNNDIIFFKDFLTSNDFNFYPAPEEYYREVSSCKFPIVYRPKLVSNSSGNKRAVELSQPQFKAEHIHTQAVYYSKSSIQTVDKNFIAAQEMKLEEEAYQLIYDLHNHTNWVVCIDSGLDGALLRNENASHSANYSFIGFSTGNGNYGKYNYTITARKDIIKIIEESFRKRLSLLFNNWQPATIDLVVKRSLEEASSLDGISLLSAINLKDNNINEFMAYVLTSFRERQKELKTPLKVLIHLDSYKHWFNNDIIEEIDNSASRSDFLSLEISDYKSDKIIINANIIECKISTINNSESHIKKAALQVEHSYKRLSQIFDPNSNSILRRYWYAQLYRALTFAQVTFTNTSSEYNEIAQKLRLILDGSFEINWSGEILGYWFDSADDTEIITKTDNNIPVYNIPQKLIQKMFINDESYVYTFVENTNIGFFRDKEEQIKYNKERQDNNPSPFQSDLEQPKPIELNVIDSKSSNSNIGNKSENLKPEPSKPDIQIKKLNEKDNSINVQKDEGPRVLLGDNKYNGQKVYWEFGNKNLANRHLLITGTSGQGKTYCIQTLLYELSKSNVSTIIFDYTEGFTPDQLDPIFKDKIGDNFIQTVVYGTGVSINPFRKYDIEVAGQIMPEQNGAVACRIRDIFSHVYEFGEQQESAVYQAVRDGLEKYGDKMSMEHFVEELESQKTPASKTVCSKILPFTDMVKFNTDNPLDWKNIIYSEKPQVYVFQLTLYDRSTQVIITEMLLWNLWYYTTRFGTKDKPFAVVLDEAQNLSHNDSSPTCKILTEGRKFGWSAWFATQSLQVLNSDEITRLLQAATKIYFKPADNEINDISKQLNPQNQKQWIDNVKRLQKGQCIVVGDRCDSSGKFVPTTPTITNITSLDKR